MRKRISFLPALLIVFLTSSTPLMTACGGTGDPATGPSSYRDHRERCRPRAAVWKPACTRRGQGYLTLSDSVPTPRGGPARRTPPTPPAWPP